ncbi:trypsin-like serine protease [Nonomuraea sp. CA-143628]|uniref:trypsin-like serine protease n=1 Tax=Nonomuraea sp. CA-143628 TaxID=3239997 RepID=UPI003D8B40F8
MSENLVLCAGHCNPEDSPHKVVPNIGQVVSSTFRTGVGSVRPPGYTWALGDISVIKAASPRLHTASIFGGDKNSSSVRPVLGRHSRGPVPGDQYCTGGITTGEICGWVVDAAYDPDDFRTTNEKGQVEVIRLAIKGSKTGNCTQGGDSGGPVYTIRNLKVNGKWKGYAYARGIHFGGTKNKATGSFLNPCNEWFTEINDIKLNIGSDIKKRKFPTLF